MAPKEVDESFEIAKQFFRRYFPQHPFTAFICYSWLLYSGNKYLLSENSNIINFAKRFEIISEIQDKEQAIKNIYGKRYRKKSDYPRHTSLQREALVKQKYLGFACGVLYV